MPRRDNATEKPSRRKLRRARKKGELAYSRELCSAAGGLAACCALALSLENIVKALGKLARGCFGGGDMALYRQALEVLSEAVLWVGGAALLAALIAGLAQAGFQLHLSIKAERLNPVAGLRRLMSVRRLTDLGISLVRVSLLCLAGAAIVWTLGPDLVAGPNCGLQRAAASAWGGLTRLGLGLILLGLFMGGFDRWLQRRRFLERQGMTRQEVLRERKDQEGDPSIKAERRKRHRQALAGTGIGALGQARLVVVNPTHLAVALAYRDGRDDAPRVLVSGREGLAACIRAEALRLEIPIVEQVSLARELIQLEPGQEIPEQLFEAVAQVFRLVDQLA